MAKARARFVRWDPKSLVNALDGEMGMRMERAAAFVAADVKRSMVGGGRPHVPSQPGEPPHVDTGGLRRSIHHNVVVHSHVVRGYVIAEHPGARALELGYAPGGLEPRPDLRPALARTRLDIARIMLGKSGPLSLADIKGLTGQGFSTAFTSGALTPVAAVQGARP